jgi:hypothetical protein
MLWRIIVRFSLFNKKVQKEQISDVDLLEITKFDHSFTPDILFRTLRHLVNYFRRGQSSKLVTGQIMVELIYQLNQSNDLSSDQKNRYILMVFQELTELQKTKKPIAPLIINGTCLKNFILPNLNLRNVYFIGCDFDEADLSKSIFIDCEFRACSFISSDLSNVTFKNNKMVGCNLLNAITDRTIGI